MSLKLFIELLLMDTTKDFLASEWHDELSILDPTPAPLHQLLYGN